VNRHREPEPRDRAGVPIDQGYWDRLKNLIPAEVSSVYVAGRGVIPPENVAESAGWAVFCLIGTVLITARQTQKIEGRSETYKTDWIHVIIASISFLIWVYVLGGPFQAFGLSAPWFGTLMMLGWTFIVPKLYEGQPVANSTFG